MADMMKRLAALAVVVSVVGVFTLGGGLAYGDGDDDDDGDDTVTVQFGESEGVEISDEIPPPVDHHLIEDPGPIDEDTTVVFDINQSALGPFGGIHQVIIFDVGTPLGDVPAPPIIFDEDFEEIVEGLFIYTGSTELPFPLPESPLDPSQDPLPQGPPRVIAAGEFGMDFAFEFEDAGTYLVVCNLNPHFLFPYPGPDESRMFRFITVTDGDDEDDEDDDDGDDGDDDDDDDDDD